jgi:hypothetical protein
MRRHLAILFCLLVQLTTAAGQDITKLEKIGPVTSFTKSEKTVLLNCQDQSQVQITILAPNLVRVRASFGKTVPLKDHSWAIAKTEWTTPRWGMAETAGAVVIKLTS